MTLIVETGSGVLNANSYESAANHVIYAALYGVTVTSTQAEINLRKGMDFIESYGWLNGGSGYKGTKQYDTTINTLEFPRTGIVINGQSVDAAMSLLKITRTLNEVALGINAGADALAIKGGKVVSGETFGPLQRQYSTNKETPIINPRVDLYLSPLLRQAISPLHFRVVSDREAAYLCGHPECCSNGCIYL
jgi:hypothetical protein